MPDGLPIGNRRFTDGTTRPVFLDQDGREYVIDDGIRVHGVWLDPRRSKRPDDEDDTASPTLIVDGLCPPRPPG
jgi:hypothetical protein